MPTKIPKVCFEFLKDIKDYYEKMIRKVADSLFSFPELYGVPKRFVELIDEYFEEITKMPPSISKLRSIVAEMKSLIPELGLSKASFDPRTLIQIEKNRAVIETELERIANACSGLRPLVNTVKTLMHIVESLMKGGETSKHVLEAMLFTIEKSLDMQQRLLES